MTEQMIEAIRDEFDSNWNITVEELAAEFGVDRKTIKRILMEEI